MNLFNPPTPLKGGFKPSINLIDYFMDFDPPEGGYREAVGGLSACGKALQGGTAKRWGVWNKKRCPFGTPPIGLISSMLKFILVCSFFAVFSRIKF